MPNPNDPNSIKAHQRGVLEAHSFLFDRIDLALAQAIPKANNTFMLYGGPIDLAVHAAITRYLTRLALAAEEIIADDEESAEYQLQRVANCGLCLRMPGSEIRILKASSGGIPKANSEARSDFYCSNQLQLIPNGGDGVGSSPAGPALRLVVLWDMDADHTYSKLEIACPRRERADGSVDCFWITPWQRQEQVQPRQIESDRSDSDLEDIKPKETRQKNQGRQG
jgi:hypothetical protein